jgi:FkbM family methyltransferase
MMDIFTDKHSGVKFCMKMGNPCADYMVNNGIYEYPIIRWCEQFLTPTGTFIDCGAHCGTFSILLSKFCKEVWAFEAQKSTFDCLSVGVSINQCNNVKINHIALGASEGEGILHHVSEDGGMSSLSKESSIHTNQKIIKEEPVKIRNLDSYNITNIDFMKIDVEGHELEVIKGATLTLINSYFPPFIFEAWPDYWYKEQREQLITYVKQLGYQVFLLSGTNHMYLASEHPLWKNKKQQGSL